MLQNERETMQKIFLRPKFKASPRGPGHTKFDKKVL